MSWFMMLAIVLGIFAVSAVAETEIAVSDIAEPAIAESDIDEFVQMDYDDDDDVDEMAMTEEQEEFLNKMATVILKAQATEGQLQVEDLVETEGRCSVTGNTARCCRQVSFKIRKRRYSIRGCVEAKLTGSFISLKGQLNGRTVFRKSISAVNPSAICRRVPIIRVLKACIKASNVHISNGRFRACFSLQAKAFRRTLANINLGCID